MSRRPLLVASCSVLAVTILPAIVLALMLRHPVHALDELAAARTLDEAISHMKAAALKGGSADWVSARSAALRTFGTSKSRESLDVALEELVQSLGDGHSLYVRPERLRAMQGRSPHDHSARLAEVDERLAGMPLVRVFTFTDLDTLRAAARAAELAQRLKRLRGAGACGAIVDLREDGGGNMWPMLSGLSPLLPQGTLLQFVDRTERRQSVVFDGRSLRLDGQEMMALAEDGLEAPAPVAVLIGERTASSGEIVAMALRANPKSVLIGRPSAGLTTGNQLFELGNGGAIAITTTRLMTRQGEPVSGPLRPDIEPNASLFGDSALRAAAEWLKGGCDTRSTSGGQVAH